MTNQQQYIRSSSLILANETGDGLELSKLRVVFKIIKSSTQTPNSALIRIYNLSKDTENRIRNEFQIVTFQAGYGSNFGLIFTGNIKQARFGRENTTDTYVEISAGDGDKAYNFSTISRTIESGVTQSDIINAAGGTMIENGIDFGFVDGFDPQSLPRGKVMYGMSRDYMRVAALSSDSTWSIQDGSLQVIKRTAVLPDEAVVLTSKTGLVGVPEQTNDGITARALLNPLIKVGATVLINQKDVEEAKLPDTKTDQIVNGKSDISADGLYRVIVAQYSGDTKANDWYTDMICLSADDSAPAGEEVSNS